MVETAFAADLRKRMQRDRAKQIYDDQVWVARTGGVVGVAWSIYVAQGLQRNRRPCFLVARSRIGGGGSAAW